MKQETITLKEVLAWIDSEAPFSLAVVTDDFNRKTGGEWIEIKQAKKFEYLTNEQQAKLSKVQPKGDIRKDPNHYDNSTRNIIFPNGEIRTIAIRLIRFFGEPGQTDLVNRGKRVM